MIPRNVLFEKALSIMNADQRYKLDSDIKAYFESVGAHKSRFVHDGVVLQSFDCAHKGLALGNIVCILQRRYPVIGVNRFTHADADGFLTFQEDYTLGSPI